MDNLRKMGVEFETNVIVGKSVTIDELMRDEHYDAVFVATGAGLPKFLGVPGEHLNGVYSANEFLTRVNLMRAYKFPEVRRAGVRLPRPQRDRGGRRQHGHGRGAHGAAAGREDGNPGLSPLRRRDAGARRRGEARPPGRRGVPHVDQPEEFLGDEKGWLTGARCVHMELGEPDASGRRSPIEIKGSDFILPVDMAVIGVGTTANPLVQSTTPDLKTTSRNYILADPETTRTSKRGVFAGGDIVTGGATVILAMGAGRKAAAAIHDYLVNGEWETAPASK